MSAVALVAGGNLGPGVREDRGNRWVILVFGVVGLLTGICQPSRIGGSFEPSTVTAAFCRHMSESAANVKSFFA
jgi:hypothetical protein